MTRGSDPQSCDPGSGHYRLAWLSLVGGAISACVVLLATGMRIAPGPLLAYAALLGLLLGAHHLYRHWRRDEKLALVTGALALMIAAALLAGVTSHAGLRLRYPLFDASLAAGDRLIGIDTPKVVLWVAESPALVWLLGLAYSSVFPLAFITAIWLGFRSEAMRLWELVLGFAASIQIASAMSVFMPAIGNIAHAKLDHLAGTLLPDGAGVYFLPAFRYYRDGADVILDASRFSGVVEFPSFHMVMAIVVAYAFRGTGIFGLVAAIWCGLVGISTVPIGGHYVVDLAAGALLWLGVMALARVPWPEGRRLAAAAPGPLA